MRAAERARKAEERAAAQLARANATEKKRLEKEAKAAHIASKEAEVEEKNTELVEIYEEIDSLLAATLEVDDYVDLETLRVKAEHPPFDRSDLETPVPTPDPIIDPEQPDFEPPVPPKGLSGLFGKKKYQRELETAKAAHEKELEEWRSKLAEADTARKNAVKWHEDAEAKRLTELKSERERYEAECATREREAADRNKQVDELIANLGYGAVEAVQEYVSIVLANSVYPDHFPVEHQFEFDASTAELKLRVLVPGPDKIPTIKTYKYQKSADEITTTNLSQKACKDRYSNAVHEVALRSVHEIFEADRRGIIKTISLEVGTVTIDPAIGREAYIPFVAVGAERDSFMEIDLSNIVPKATLDHLGAAVSKNPFGLVAANVSGVRRS